MNYKCWPNEEFNTLNAWGFGGGIGTIYKKDGWEIRKGKAYFRHLPSQSFLTISNREKGIPRLDIKEKDIQQFIESNP